MMLRNHWARRTMARANASPVRGTGSLKAAAMARTAYRFVVHCLAETTVHCLFVRIRVGVHNVFMYVDCTAYS